MRWNYSYLKLEISQYNANKHGTRKNIQWFSTFGLRHSDMAFGCPNDYACVFCAVPMIHCNVWDHPTHSEIALPKMSLGPLWINSVSRNLASIHVARGLALEINERRIQATVARNTGKELWRTNQQPLIITSTNSLILSPLERQSLIILSLSMS